MLVKKTQKEEFYDSIITLSASLRELFELMHFPGIPDGATHVGFTKDGMAQFMALDDMLGLMEASDTWGVKILATTVYRNIPVSLIQ